MPADVRELLARGASSHAQLDEADVLRRARWLARRDRGLAVLAVLLVAPVLALGIAELGGDTVELAGPVPTPPETLPLPPAGQARAEMLADGTPIWVVHEQGGEVMVLDARSPHDAWGLTALVQWCPSTGFIDARGNRFDARGRYLGGPPPTGLIPFEVEVRAGRVEVGDALAPPSRDEAGESSPAGTCGDAEQVQVPHDLGGTSAAEDLSPTDGALRLVEAALIVSDAGPVLCPASASLSGEPPSCPEAVPAPSIDPGYLPARTWNVLEGRMLVTIDDRPAATEVVLLGDAYAPVDSNTFFGFVTKIHEQDGELVLIVDERQVLHGEDARRAAEHDGVPDPDRYASEGYPADTEVPDRPYRLAQDAVIAGLQALAGTDHIVAVPTAELVARFPELDLTGVLFNFTVQGDLIVRLQEMGAWLPR